MRFWTKRKVIGDPMVTMVIVAYERGPQLQSLIGSLRAQTYPHFQATVYHDGPCSPKLAGYYKRAVEGDDRFSLKCSSSRAKAFGHNLRRIGIQEANGQFIGFANDDGFYCPVYLEALLNSLTTNNSDFAYCDMIHSHRMWSPISSTLERGRIDIGNWLARTSFVKNTAWTSSEFHADWLLVKAMLDRKMRAHKVKGYFYTHN